YDSSKEYISSDDYDDVMRKGKPLIGDVLFTTEAPLGNVAQVDDDKIALAQRVIKFRAGKYISNTFLKYYMLGDGFQKLLQLNSIGSTVLGIQGKVLHKLPMLFPSPQEQKKISDCLTSIDDVIFTQKQKLKNLKTHKRSLMQQLFPAVDEVGS
ncbi:restriction endonuclease subunit S, partial [Endozoicomonas sp. SESOKO4]|uniref:restriction endonuclease subunit S n=1 Tax=Endozoicomonas sp. SESOKO4 TaxID=2828745 RepID=UPI002148DFD9